MRTPSKPVRGFSMIELMVAMVIGLIGMTIILQVFEVSEGIKRTTTSGGDAQQNGAIAAYVLEHDIRNSGMGFNDTPWAGCSMVGWDNTVTPSALPAVGATMLLAPVRIVPGANSYASDQVTIIYGSQTHSASGSQLSTTMTASTDPLRVNSVYGYHPGDLIVVMESPPAPPALPKNCSLMEITSIAADALSHDAVSYSYTPPGGSPVTVPSRFNKPGGLGITYVGGPGATQQTMVYNLGSAQGGSTLPVYSTYSISNSTLTVTPAFTVGAPPVVADNIVHMRALYGMDDGSNNNTITTNAAYTASDGVVDSWIDGTVNPNWQFVIAIKIAVLARSTLKEKSSQGPGAPCDTTTVEPTWTGSVWANNPWNLKTRLDVSKNPDGTDNLEWQCYRYRVFEATIPLRNWVWSSS
jgi:type IV pilus assembly protein PilW